jgi:hypothetical protein
LRARRILSTIGPGVEVVAPAGEPAATVLARGRTMRTVIAALAACFLLGACAQEAKSCSAGNFSCGDPAGGPACCPNGDSCCFHYDVCCRETTPHLGVRRSDGARMCYQNLNGEGVTWDLLTVCGKPAG